MHIHILGVCGTFMAGIARIASEAGFKVTGSDQNCYPPMSTQLEEMGIKLYEGYSADNIKDAKPDLVVIGNAMSRGNEAVEYVLEERIPYTSGPQWLYEHILLKKQVIAVSGTHGKTTTTSIITHILEELGENPSFLVGGIPQGFARSSRATDSKYFVIEADEYDTAFFDKRSKFVHYHPNILVVNNLEFDHADIFDSIEDIKRQFHHVIRTVPKSGTVITPCCEEEIESLIAKGLWSQRKQVSLQENCGDYFAKVINDDYSNFEIYADNSKVAEINWTMPGKHNLQNALSAFAAVMAAGFKAEEIASAINSFPGVKRRMELKGEVRGVKVYDDFAHHPTAIKLAVDSMRRKVKDGRVIAVLEPRSNTMKLGTMRQELPDALKDADKVFIFQPKEVTWDVSEVAKALGENAKSSADLDSFVEMISSEAKDGDSVVIMSNGGFGGIYDKLLNSLKA